MTLLVQKKLLQLTTMLPWRPTLPMECVHKKSDICSRGLCAVCVRERVSVRVCCGFSVLRVIARYEKFLYIFNLANWNFCSVYNLS